LMVSLGQERLREPLGNAAQGCMLRVGQRTTAIMLFTRSCTASCKVRLARRKLLFKPAASPKARPTEYPLE
jgi:hypothetical protein